MFKRQIIILMTLILMAQPAIAAECEFEGGTVECDRAVISLHNEDTPCASLPLEIGLWLEEKRGYVVECIDGLGMFLLHVKDIHKDRSLIRELEGFESVDFAMFNIDVSEQEVPLNTHSY